MKLKSILLVLILMLVGTACNIKQFATNEPVQKRMNVLFIAVDDLKPVLGCYGDTIVKSPNIDRLAEQGFIFSNNHTQQAVCGPTRASLLTGKRPDYTKVYDLKTQMRDMNPDILTLPQYFKQNGYQTAAVGKIFDPRCVDITYDSISWSYPYEKTKNKEYDLATQKVSYEENERPDYETIDGEIAASGISYLQKFADEKKPFFLAVGFKKPHLPFVANKKYWDMYPLNTIKLPEYQKAPEGAPIYATQPSWELRSGYDDVPKDFEMDIPINHQLKLIQGYYACVSFIDAQIGLVVDELDRLGLRENTIIVLWGDHGFHLGDHNMFCKHTNYEQATRSPLIIAFNGKKFGKLNTPTEFVDVFPTLCELSGLETPANLDGKSLVPLMEKKATKIKDFAVSQFPRDGDKMGYAFRDDRYRYVIWIKDRKNNSILDKSSILDEELYDYEVDPEERKNLISDKQYSSVKNKLQAQAFSFLTITKE